MSEGFAVNDRRAGIITGQTVADARREASTAGMEGMASKALALGRTAGVAPTNEAEAREMNVSRLQHGGVGRLMSRKTATMGRAPQSQMQFATQRPHDPQWYFQQNNLLYDIHDDRELKVLRAICRQIALAHPVIGPAIDIFSQWPLIGMEFSGKDEEINEFHSTLFLDQLNYEEFLPLVGREYWTVGEAFPLGSFNETLGVWEDDELINPDSVTVEQSPFIKEPRFFMELPETLRNLIRTQQPRHEYEALMRSYPELRHFMRDGSKMPVSSVLLKHLRFRADAFCQRGVPILYRALRSVVQEEMLNSAQDSISDRLSTPLILAKIGASATDLGTQQPWVPTIDQISDFEATLDMALAADFRVLTTHFAVNMESVFGRETMPNFDADFDRLTEKQLQVFGLSKTMLSGAEGGETYAADALNRDLVTQLLSTYQRYIKRFVKERMLVVAEAQGHWDYEVRGGKRYPIMEEVLVVDEESGEQRVEEQPKLLVPDLHLRVMNLKDEEAEHQFFEQLRGAGVPISMKTRLINVPIDLDEEREQAREEAIQGAVEEQLTRRAVFEKLQELRLPIPPDLANDFAPKANNQSSGPQIAADPSQLPTQGADDPSTPTLTPDPTVPPGTAVEYPRGPAGVVETDEQGLPTLDGPDATVIPLPRNRVLSRPEESDEQRKKMPKGSHYTANAVPQPVESVDLEPLRDAGGEVLLDEANEPIVSTLVNGPRHVGVRSRIGLSKDTVIGEEEEDRDGTSG